MSNSSVLGGGLSKACPSVFDYCLYCFAYLSPIAFWVPWDLNMFQRLFFSFSILSLLIVSLSLKREREYKNRGLSAFLILSFVICLIHSMALKTPSVVYNYVLFTYMVEGFLYIFSGVILFWMVVTYSRSFNIVYPIILINILNLVFVISQLINRPFIFLDNNYICGLMGTKSQLALFSAVSIPLVANFKIKGKWCPIVLIPIFTLFASGSFTSLIALIGTTAYFIISGKVKVNKFIGYSLLLFLVGFILFNYHHFILKLLVRIDLLISTIKSILLSPIIGIGYDNGITMNKVYTLVDNGMTYIQNDLLNFARDMGIPLALFLVFIIYRILRGSKISNVLVATVILLSGCLIQTNFYFPRIAVIGILLLAILEKEKYGLTQPLR